MTQPTSILVAEDNHVTREVLQRRLGERGYTVHLAEDGEAALRAVKTQQVDLVLLDLMMPHMDGLAMLKAVREEHPASELPVVVLTVKEGSEDVVEALRLGANDYVTKTVDFSVILARIETQLSLRRMMAKVRELSIRDPLTGLYNRRGFYELAEKEEAKAQRYGQPLQAMMIDIDNFKQVNDTYGHKVGDRVLVETSRRCREAMRSGDVLGRWGGEEFAALLPGVGVEGAIKTAERLRQLTAASPVETSGGPVSVTLSVGVASFDGSCANLSDLLGHVDQALYAAKRGGRNRVELFNSTQQAGD